MPPSPSVDLDQILTINSLKWAWRRVRANHGAAGADDVTIRHFGDLLEPNLLALIDDVASGTYQPGPVRFVHAQELHKVRRLAILPVRDRVLQRAVLDRLAPHCEPQFLDCSYAYRPKRSLHDAVSRIVRLRKRGLTDVVDADIRDCFGSLDHEVLLESLTAMVPTLDPRVLDLIRSWIAMPQRPRRHRANRPRAAGVLQGAPISPLLCNVYLHNLDRSLAKRRLLPVRYADDFVILCRSPEHAARALRTTQKLLRGLRLTIHPGKTSITCFEQGFRFLGVTFDGDSLSYVTEDKRIVIDDHSPDWFLYGPDDNY